MRTRLACAASVLALLVSLAAAVPAYADDSAPCADVTVVFARGSGQVIGEPRAEAERFFQGIQARVGSGVRLNLYELGQDSQGGHKYPAAGVGIMHPLNTIQADIGWFPFGDYGESVTEGVGEATAYLTARAGRCDDLFVIGGYSQGAQVMGDALAELPTAVLDKIAYVAFFGDPKLYLPEGKGIFPAACRGGDLSPWRRGNVSCWTDGGILEARVPYLPSQLENRSGSWCDREDPICNNNPGDIVGSTHGNYKNEGNAIDQAVLEAARALAARLPDHADDLNLNVLIIGAGTTGIDVAFVIDTTGSMADDIDEARSIAAAMASEIVELRGRVALTEYRDDGDAFTAEIRSPLSDNTTTFLTALAPLSADGGGDTPEALLHALMVTFNGLDWRDGATKAAVVLTDADYHDPDLVDGSTLAAVVTRSLEIDPVNVYAVVPASLTTSYQALTTQTAGQVVANTGDTSEALLAAITEISYRPTVLLKINEYWAAPGTPVTFDASDSYDPDSELTIFEWDFDNDGTIDETTTEPTATHVYPAAFEGLAEVRVHSADGGVANAVAFVHINSSGLEGMTPHAPSVSYSTEDVAADHRTVKLSWAPAASGPAATMWRIKDGSGRLLGQVSSEIGEVDIPGVPNSAVSISVTGVNAFGEGAAAHVDVAARSETATPPATTATAAPTTAAAPTTTAAGTPATVPSTAVPTTTAGSPGAMPRTGSSIMPQILVGLGAILGGVILLLIVRLLRRRSAE